MKTLKDVLEASILDNAISEASLLDIEGSIEYGDKINDQFEKIKSIITDPNAYRKINRHSNMRIDIRNIENILSFVGLNKQTGLLVSIDKRREPDGWGDYADFWYFNILIMDDKDVEFKERARGLSFPKFLQKYVAPRFKDIESFKKLIEDKK